MSNIKLLEYKHCSEDNTVQTGSVEFDLESGRMKTVNLNGSSNEMFINPMAITAIMGLIKELQQPSERELAAAERQRQIDEARLEREKLELEISKFSHEERTIEHEIRMLKLEQEKVRQQMELDKLRKGVEEA